MPYLSFDWFCDPFLLLPWNLSLGVVIIFELSLSFVSLWGLSKSDIINSVLSACGAFQIYGGICHKWEGFVVGFVIKSGEGLKCRQYILIPRLSEPGDVFMLRLICHFSGIYYWGL